MNHISWQSIQLFTANRGKVRAPDTNLFIFPITVKNHIYIDILCKPIMGMFRYEQRSMDITRGDLKARETIQFLSII